MKVAVIGSNRGIGLAIVKTLVEQGHEVYSFCRQSSAELCAVQPKKIIEDFDLAETQNVTQIVQSFGLSELDCLIHVAGLMFYDDPRDLDEAQMIAEYQVNAIGPLKTFHAFRPYLKSGGKVAIVSSRMGSIEDNTSGGYYGFRMSKAALNMGIKTLSIDLVKENIGVFLLHPGFVKTKITNFEGQIEPEESAEQLLALLASLDIKDTGTFWHANGSRIPW